MRLHRFFLDQEIGDKDTLTVHDPDLFHQLRSVFRFTIGGQVILFDNSGFDYHALIASFDAGAITFSLISKKETVDQSIRELHLFVSLIKKGNFEWALEKGTELGVTRFVPLLSDRSEKKGFNLERAEKIMKEASEQSGRSILPSIAPLTSFEDALVLSSEFPCFAFHPEGDIFTIEHTHTYSPLGAFIGPEGGWTDREVFLFKKENIKVHSLGSQILRAETAAVAVSSIILLQ